MPQTKIFVSDRGGVHGVLVRNGRDVSLTLTASGGRKESERFTTPKVWEAETAQSYAHTMTTQAGKRLDRGEKTMLPPERANNPRKRNPKRLHHSAHYPGGVLAMEQDRVIFALDFKSDGSEFRKGETGFITVIPTGAKDDATVYVQSINHPHTPPIPVALRWLSPMLGKKGWPRGTKPKGNPRKRKAATTGKYAGVPGYSRAEELQKAAAAKRKQNPDAFVIALYTDAGTRLTYHSHSNRFTNTQLPSLYRTQIAAKDRAELLLKRIPKLARYKITVEHATPKEAGSVFGARPRTNPGKRATMKCPACLGAGFTHQHSGDRVRGMIPVDCKTCSGTGRVPKP